MSISESSTAVLSHSTSLLPDGLTVVFAKSFFAPWGRESLYRPHNPPKPDEAFLLCDYVIAFRDVLILINTPQVLLDDEANLASQWANFRKTAVTRARKRLDQAERWILSGQAVYDDVHCQQPIDVNLATYKHIHKLCITTGIEQMGEQRFPLLHRYGSGFYREESVGEIPERPVQLFSAGEFGNVIETLDNFDDFLNFLSFHESAILDEEQVYQSETDLMNLFIQSGAVFASARRMQHQLSLAGLLDDSSPIIESAVGRDALALFKEIQATTVYWNGLTLGYRLRLLQHLANQTAQGLLVSADYYRLLAAMHDESLAARWLLSLHLQLRKQHSADQRESTFLMQTRSCTREGRHYLFFFYAEQPEALQEAYRIQAKSQLRELAEMANAKFQEPHLSEIVVLGVQTQDGDATSVDILFKIGHVLDGSVQAVSRGTLAAEPKAADPKAVAPISTPSTPTAAVPVSQSAASPAPSAAQITPPASRNDPCPCGSGQRYKHCCGAKA